MSKTNGKLKYDLSLSTTSVYDASSIYINKSAELSINGNAKLQYQSIGATYGENNVLGNQPIPNGQVAKGKQYIYIRNLGPEGAAPINIAYKAGSATGIEQIPPIGIPAAADESQIMSLNVGEFAFFPMFTEFKTPLQLRSGYIVGSTYWTGPTYNDIEYMIAATDHNIGPDFQIKD